MRLIGAGNNSVLVHILHKMPQKCRAQYSRVAVTAEDRHNSLQRKVALYMNPVIISFSLQSKVNPQRRDRTACAILS